MSLLDGDIASLFGDVFGSIYLPGTLRRTTVINAGGGRNSTSVVDVSVKVQVDACTEAMRNQDGYTSDDVRLLILQKGLTQPITTDDVVIVPSRNATYKVATVTQDPAASYFECRGVLRKV